MELLVGKMTGLTLCNYVWALIVNCIRANSPCLRSPGPSNSAIFVVLFIVSTDNDPAHFGAQNKDLKNIKNVKGCRDVMPKSMQTR